jgi:hypothetical protein
LFIGIPSGVTFSFFAKKIGALASVGITENEKPDHARHGRRPLHEEKTQPGARHSRRPLRQKLVLFLFKAIYNE